jgi:hypothetical protein
LRQSRWWLVGLAVISCTAHDLRGSSTPSPDGRTYLVIADDNGGQCGPLTVDGAPWPHAVGVPGAIEPGDHLVACGSEVAVRVDSGRTFRLDYWGP